MNFREILERFKNPMKRMDVGLWGDFGMQVFDVSSGTPKRILRIRKKNQITNDGRTALLSLLGTGEPGTPPETSTSSPTTADLVRRENQVWSISVGTNPTAPTVSDTIATLTEVWNSPFTFPAECAIVATPPNSFYLSISKTLAVGDANEETLTEAGILTRGNNDTPASSTTKALYARQIHSPILKTDTMTIQYDWQLGITIA